MIDSMFGLSQSWICSSDSEMTADGGSGGESSRSIPAEEQVASGNDVDDSWTFGLASFRFHMHATDERYIYRESTTFLTSHFPPSSLLLGLSKLTTDSMAVADEGAWIRAKGKGKAKRRDEIAPLLAPPAREDVEGQKPTQAIISRGQFIALLVVYFAEPISCTFIYPFIAQVCISASSR